MLAYCGLLCSKCPALIAAQQDDQKQREEVARLWSKEFHAEIKPEDINCDGCKSETGRLFNHCRVCKIRGCAREKGVDTCAHCPGYACGDLSGFFNFAPMAKTALEEIREKIRGDKNSFPAG